MDALQDYSLNPLEANSKPLPSKAGSPIVPYEKPENMTTYYAKLKAALDNSQFEVVQSIDSDGLYIGKRAIRGAQGQGELLNQAGTVFYHVLLYVKTDGKTSALEYGPQGSADVTANVMEAVPCSHVLLPDAVPEPGCALLKVNISCLTLSDPLVKQAIKFVQSRKYHAIYNNCIKNTDFLCRVLTKGLVKDAPMIYDALAGKVPEQDHPLLQMFFLMTQMSWFDVCDGSKMSVDFMALQGGSASFRQQRSSLDLPQGLKSTAEDVRISEHKIDLQSVLNKIGAGNPHLAKGATEDQ